MQVLTQNLKNGETVLQDCPAPQHRAGSPNVLISNTHSLISIGTERMLVDFGKANLLSKAQQQPDKVKMVLEKAATDGVLTTMDAVKSKLDQPIQLGYCAAGVVLHPGQSEFAVGDRVVSNGHHADIVSVSRNLVAKVPDNVSLMHAAFTPAAAIGLQGIRLANPTLGETVVVMGLGLIGLLTVQLLVAQGCKVIGTDFDDAKVALAESFGAIGLNVGGLSDVIGEIRAHTGPTGADAVLITASSKSSDPVHQAATVCRQRGRIVLVGVTGLELRRSDFYEKELSFQVSCSYGPGRYDPFHEEEGHDYPLGFVRWTQKRNFEAVLQLITTGKLDIEPLVSLVFPFEQATEAYRQVSENAQALGIVLEYSADEKLHGTSSQPMDTLEHTIVLGRASTEVSTNTATDSSHAAIFIGAGNYASRVLIPAFKSTGISLDTLVSSGGVSSAIHGEKQGFKYASTDVAATLSNKTANMVVIGTQHDTHAALVVQVLQAGKIPFVEKPLALSVGELESVVTAVDAEQIPYANPIMVGFNRRFSPLVQSLKQELDKHSEPMTFNFTVNAGAIPADSWIQSASKGGGRIIGEACHHIDLMRFLANSPITRVQAMGMGSNQYHDIVEDKAIVNLQFGNGSVGSIQYFANGGKAFPKERFEVFVANSVFQLDNFRSLKRFGGPKFRTQRSFKQDKGQRACVSAFVDGVKAGTGAPIAFAEIVEVSRATLEAAEQIRQQQTL